MRFLLASIGVFVCQLALATGVSLPDYYGNEFIQGYENGSLKNEALISSLHKIISQKHRPLGYEGARKQLFGKLFLSQDSGGFFVKDVYCEQDFTDDQLEVGPGLIPDGNIINTEHTWPQSRFTHRFPKEAQKSDLHHLFPTDNKMNSHRGALRFGEVVEDVEKLKCPIAQVGHSEQGEIVFEVPLNHKGNAARAIFYFATRYQMKISPAEDAELRRWHKADPADASEKTRNEEIHKAQGNRNPYIDFPDLVERISRFN